MGNRRNYIILWDFLQTVHDDVSLSIVKILLICKAGVQEIEVKLENYKCHGSKNF